MFRREAVLHAGNYQDFPGFEDYYLWVRMLRKGCKGYNVQEVILDMRTGNAENNRGKEIKQSHPDKKKKVSKHNL